MSDVNYISPSSVLPKLGYTPTGFLGGMQYQQQMQDYGDMMGLSKLMAQMEAQKQREELEQGAPVRQSKRLADIATNNSTAATVGRRNEAEVGQLEDKARVSRAGVDDTIAQNHAESIQKQGAAALAKFQQDLQGALQLGAILQQNGPAGAAMVQQKAQQMGLDPDMVKALMVNPQKTIQHLQAVDRTLQDKLLTQREDNAQKNAGALAVAEEHTRASKYTADRAYDRAAQAAAARQQLATAQTDFQKSASALLAKQATLRQQGKDLPPAELEQLKFLTDIIIKMRTAVPELVQEGSNAFLQGRQPNAVGAPPIPGQAPAPSGGWGPVQRVK